MDSLAAYNGAILNGRFAELDEAATGKQAEAAAIMYQYEESCSPIAAPWDQPIPPDVCNGAALESERHAKDVGDGAGRRWWRTNGWFGGSADAGAPDAIPRQGRQVQWRFEGAATDRLSCRCVRRIWCGSEWAVDMARWPRLPGVVTATASTNHRYPAATLDGSGEASAGLSDTGASWLPATEQSDAPFMVSNVSWGPSTSVFDELAVPDQPEAPAYADEPERTLEQVSSRWVAPPVIGVDKGLTL